MRTTDFCEDTSVGPGARNPNSTVRSSGRVLSGIVHVGGKLLKTLI